MKLIVMAAALALGGTAFAQQTTVTNASDSQAGAPAQDGAMSQSTTATPTDGTMPPMNDQTMSTTGAPMAGAPMAGAPMAGAPAGGPVTVMPSRPVAEAFPAPAPKASYPRCTRTLRDGCTNPGGK